MGEYADLEIKRERERRGRKLDNLILGHALRQQMAARIASLCWRPDVECYYFGWVERSGHRLLKRAGRWSDNAYDEERVLNKALGPLDCGLCWNFNANEPYAMRDETEGRALVTRRGGWTAIAFWDRSGDKRPACNTAFIARGDLTFSQVVRVARHQWPSVWARFTFEVVEVDRDGRLIPS